MSERTIARFLRRIRRRGDTGQKWLAFLVNHREVINAFDFFTVPSVTFKLLYGFFIIEHGRRKILHFNTTSHPTAEWVVQQLREAFSTLCSFRSCPTQACPDPCSEPLAILLRDRAQLSADGLLEDPACVEVRLVNERNRLYSITVPLWLRNVP